ncbi:MAG: hypothetical protein K6F64_04540 [Clostridia bacterium]|nr:hypothetical protein [Clostridia bacterium]
MKKLIALALCLTLLFTLASCEIPGKTPKPEETETETTQLITVPEKEPVSFEDATHELSIALTIGLRYTINEDSLNYPSSLWDIFGWFCAYSSKKGHYKELTENQISSLQYAIRPGKTPLNLPEGWDGSGWVKIERTENGYVYSFPGYEKNFDEYFGNLKFKIKDDENNTVKVTVTDEENDVTEDFVYTYAKDKKAGADFPYVINSIELPEYDGATEYSADTFTYNDLIESNKISSLLDKYTSVKIEEINEEGPSTSWYYRENGIYYNASETTNPNGEILHSGAYGNAYLNDCGDHWMTYVDPYNDGYEEGTYALDYAVNGMFFYGEIDEVEDTEDGFLFEIKDAYNNEDDGFKRTYLIDKSTLALKEMKGLENGKEIYSVKITYDEEPEDYGIFDSWDEEFRTITVVEEFYNSKGEVANGAHDVSVPKNVEYLPMYDEEVNIYVNSNYSGEYSYPGNDIDYSIYVTNAMG